VEAVLAVVRVIRGVVFLAQPFENEFGEGVVVFDQENPHFTVSRICFYRIPFAGSEKPLPIVVCVLNANPFGG
jgi:hypothetical protein